jgi:hypothetical protein
MEFQKGQLNFNKDIKTGKEGEAFIRVFLENLGYVFLGECDNNAYDLKMAYMGQEYTYEVKTDTYKNTGNMAIEFESRGKASGINVTQATYFTYFFPHLGEIWNIRCSKLRKLIAHLSPYVHTGGDPGSNTKFYLIKKTDVEKYFRVHRIENSLGQ